MADHEGEEDRYTFHAWKYCHYFDFVSVKDAKNILVPCKLCAGSKPLSTVKNRTTASNLLKHLQHQHCNVKLDEKTNAATDTEAFTVSGCTPAETETGFQIM